MKLLSLFSHLSFLTFHDLFSTENNIKLCPPCDSVKVSDGILYHFFDFSYKCMFYLTSCFRQSNFSTKPVNTAVKEGQNVFPVAKRWNLKLHVCV